MKRADWTGLIMAGGRGLRMAASGVAGRKPLIMVRGVSLLERNVWMMARAGCTDIRIAIGESDLATERVELNDLAMRASGIGVTIGVVMEDRPLGNFGAATLVGAATDLMVVYADNLTLLDLAALAQAHRQSGGAMTLAAHVEPFRLPYGELDVDAARPGRLRGYREKPLRELLVSSGLAIVSAAALAELPKGEEIGLSDAANRLLAGGLEVALFRHSAPWIDVNDAAKLRDADALVASHAAFDAWWPDAPTTDLRVAAQGPERVLHAMTSQGVVQARLSADGTVPVSALGPLWAGRFGGAA
ncbi:nucleotidyltransferase family protein [Sphingomonas baiyangensis]|uniref:Nucleotidyl transferase domain-containing protein n=1 Tax=Sphingomonas baiyangensis TaxID=2572576 RepID=A0A4U1L0M6_9SPHN|nr:sugar phosphate nucleotidyltransferase [Sphingomonas baiyangensis]TKD50152.1 hypothetical protein FBR43_04810 [Sphingomonas baiyangensis]